MTRYFCRQYFADSPLPRNNAVSVVSVLRGIKALHVFLFVLILSGCAARLAPDYDQSFYDQIVSVNQSVGILFSELEINGAKSGFSKASVSYAKVLGSLKSLHILSQSRPLPSNLEKLSKIKSLSEICGQGHELSDCLNDTPDKLEEIIAIVTAVRDRHQLHGVSQSLLSGYQNAYTGLMQQILVYEGYLEYPR